MTKGIATPPYIPLRKDPSHLSEMISQLLFGETFDIIDSSPGSWIRVKNHYDDYKGWIYRDPSCLLTEESADILEKCKPFILNRRFTTLTSISCDEELVVSAGSTLYLDPDDASRVYAGHWYRLDRPVEALSGDIHSRLHYLAGQFLNSPYIWGGKSAFGTDCSGLVQTLFRIIGIMIKRDSGEQHKEGKTVNMLSDSVPGDLVFFDDEDGEIVHTGVLLDKNLVLHASGRVRVDPIDHQGIYNESTGNYSHKLRLIKRIIE